MSFLRKQEFNRITIGIPAFVGMTVEIKSMVLP